MFRFAVLAA
jgi:hypothetical protein